MPKELHTLTLLGVVQSQASAPGCGAALLGQVAPACRRVRRGRLSCPWGLQAVPSVQGQEGGACGLGGKVPWGSISAVTQKMIAVRTLFHLGRCDFFLVKRLIIVVSGNW